MILFISKFIFPIIVHDSIYHFNILFWVVVWSDVSITILTDIHFKSTCHRITDKTLPGYNFQTTKEIFFVFCSRKRGGTTIIRTTKANSHLQKDLWLLLPVEVDWWSLGPFTPIYAPAETCGCISGPHHKRKGSLVTLWRYALMTPPLHHPKMTDGHP